MDIKDYILLNSAGNLYWKGIDGKYLGCNKAFADICGFDSPEYIVGKDDFELFSQHMGEESVRKLVQVDRDVMDNGIEYVVEEVGINISKEKAIYLTKKIPLKDNEGKLLGLIGSSIDIQKQKDAENKILEENQSKTRVLNVLQKEIMTIVDSMVSELDAAGKPTCENPRVMAGRAIDHSQKIGEIFGVVSDYLTTENPQSSDEPIEEVVNIKANILKYMNTYGKMHGNVDAELHFKDKSINKTNGNGRAIRKVLRIIVKNAYRFAKNKLCVSVIKQDVSDQPFISIEVTNDGKTISDNDINDILNMFDVRHGDIRYSTLGPNLALASLTIKKLGGTLGIQSSVKNGTCIKITIPHIEPTRTADGKINVLIVDDNEISRKAQKRILEEKGCVVDEASCAEESFSFLNKKYNLILMDLSLPTMSGIEVTQCFRNTGANMTTPIIAITANPIEDVHNDCMHACMDEVLAKPLRSDDLESLIEQYCL